MQVQLVLPDEFAHRLQNKWGNLEGKLFEILILEAYRDGTISTGKVRELMGFSTRLEVDSWLQSKGIDLPYTDTDWEADHQTHDLLKREGRLNIP